jgi:hypothetical protein
MTVCEFDKKFDAIGIDVPRDLQPIAPEDQQGLFI